MKTITSLKLKHLLCQSIFLTAFTIIFLSASFYMKAYATNGNGVVTVTSNSACVGYTPAQGGGPDNWEVIQGGDYNITIAGVTECSGSEITIFFQNSNTGNWCITATGSGGVYSGSFTMPNPACFTTPISYKCGGYQPCDNANTLNAKGPSGSKSVHLRASNFNGSCVKTSTDEDCNSGSTCNLSLELNGTDVSCHGDYNGTIDLTVSGAQSNDVSYLWNDGAITEDRTDLSPGTYTVTVSDGGTDCQFSKSISIGEPDAIVLNVMVTGVTTAGGGSDGTIDITVTGGTTPYTFLWNDGTTTANRADLTPGIYALTLTDAHGCGAAFDTSLVIHPDPCSLSVNAGPDASKCHGKSLMLSAVCADQTATFSWSPTTGLNNPNIANPITTVGQTTTYTVTVNAANGCTASDEVVVTAYEQVKAKITIKTNNASCGAPCKRLSTAFDANYVYTWRYNGADATVGNIHSNIYCACQSGTYAVWVTDTSIGCTHHSKKIEITIGQKMQEGDQIAEVKDIQINAWPNPVTDYLNVTILNVKEGAVSVQLFDMFGRLINTVNMNGNKLSDNETINFNMNDLSSGMYLVRMINGDYRGEQKVMLIK
ncbi:MAG: T9SS type A sorting domain-containing protein [Chitinophagales bacterium]